MEMDIKQQRNLSMAAIREHVASMKYTPHREDKEKFLEVNNIQELEKVKLERRKAAEKVNNYAKYVKEMYWPHVSDRKREEIEQLRISLDPKSLKKSSSNKGILSHKNNYLASLHDSSLVDIPGTPDSSKILFKVMQVLDVVKKKKKIDWGNHRNTPS